MRQIKKDQKKNEADCFFRPNFKVYIGVDNRERVRARDKKNKGEQFRLKNNMKIL